MFALPFSPARTRSGFSNDALHTCDTTFSFGQRGNHFLQCASRHDYTRLPPKLAALLSSNQVRKVHHVALGYENSFLMTWRDQKGQDRIDTQGIPDDLNDFLFAPHPQQPNALLRSIPNIRLTLGPYNTSFFITDGSAYLWLNLPPDLLAALQLRIKNGTWLDRPRIVALGADASFLLITEKHAAVWDLHNYAVLTKMMEFSRSQSNGIEEVKNVVLHAYRYQCFVAESWNGTLLHNNLPPHELPGVEVMRVAILKEAQERERRDGEKERRKVVERPNRSELKEQASLRRQWGDHQQEFTAKTKGKGLSLSLSLSVSAKGLAGGLGLR
ncbi:hypothetical protein CC80DRAFT_465214 [Byssothecium circinans]|uniref:Uncharacterized protein n=1 Tax=Byssothecium circinans TaxID=147558 RepID=A0A6A5UAJ6_9PLEO|nr:hypothetical protein CC80DRAFT_465214 [Byssothecium circinans]